MPDHLEFHQKNVKRPIGDIEEITSIHFGKEVESIDAKAFEGFFYLEKVTFDPECKITTIQRETFHSCLSLEAITLPDSITTIKYGAFNNCRNLNKINLPENLTTIEIGSFSNCDSLNKIKLPENLTTIERDTFRVCFNLKSIKIPDNVKYIRKDAFNHCCSFTTINLPKNLESIGNWAFENCTELKSVTILDGTRWIGRLAFASCPNLTEINLQKSKINDLDFSNPNEITQEQLNEFNKYVGLPEYCNVKVTGQILEPDSHAKIQQCEAILADEKNPIYNNARFQMVIGYQMSYAYYKTGDLKETSRLLKLLKELEPQYLVNSPEWKKQCTQIRELITKTKAREKMLDFGKKVELLSKYQKTLYESKKSSSNAIEKFGNNDRQM